MILKILLNFPEELKLRDNLSAIPENKAFTLDAKISMESGGTNYNGLYVSRSFLKNYYLYNKDAFRIYHRSENGQ